MLAIPRRKMGIFVSLLPDMPICPLPQKWFWVKCFPKFVNGLSHLCKVCNFLSVYNLNTWRGKQVRGWSNVVRTCPQTGKESELRNDRARCRKKACQDPDHLRSDPYSLRHSGRHLPHRDTRSLKHFQSLSVLSERLFFPESLSDCLSDCLGSKSRSFSRNLKIPTVCRCNRAF